MQSTKAKEITLQSDYGDDCQGDRQMLTPAEPLLMYKAKEDKEQTEEENVKCEDLKAPVGLLMKVQ